ncbi:hypothetical protein JZ751_008659 [Albula glossodonta]|uniref:HAUS augmin-like complex subunit 6 N-terminal domain-containing protein n=1 Tax=Albula glossodonta TaxID=121402 RepID=A0A8T2NYT6_9TELE|nr:hypothetical protein JZ751_008659 [Albula glossodonta]
MSTRQKSNAQYLWWTLLGLGFQPEIAAATSKASIRHITLGIHMFDKPNKDAFYIVTHFLFEKLNPARAHEMFRHCWPVMDRKADAEFRKVTFSWIRDLGDKCGKYIPKVVASLFLSPGGPKFINVMLQLAKYVMLQEMKSFSTDKTWVPEASAAKAQSVETAMLRYQLVKMRFQRAAVWQDCVVQEYQRRAQSLVKSMRDLRSEDAKYDSVHEQESEEEMCLQSEKILKVRSLWADVNKILSTLEEERKVVDCVVKGNVDQYSLDGTSFTLKIPKALLERIERSAHMSSAGNLYEAGQLNLLRLLELLNEALCLLQEERVLAGAAALQLDLQDMEEKALHLKGSLEACKLLRKKISQEDIPEVKGFIQNMEVAWNRKWEDCLRRKPLPSFLNEDPALDFLSPMAPLSFEPATEAKFKSSIFSSYSAKFPELPPISQPSSAEPIKEEAPAKIPDSLENAEREMVDLHDPQSFGHHATQPSETSTISTAVSSRPLTPCKDPSPCPVQKDKSLALGDPCLKACGWDKKAMILDMECDNLANQFAEAVTASPTGYRIRGLELEDLLGNLADPFSTRKQLPRTPESLISEVKSSWRRAVAEGEAEKSRLSGRLIEGSEKAFTPLPEAAEACPSSGLDRPQAVTSHLRQQGESLHSTLSWDSALLEATQGHSSDVIQFGIAFETMPELPGSESLLSSSDGAMETSSVMEEDEEDELVLPRILPNTTEPEMELHSARCRFDRIRKVYSEASFTDCRAKMPEPPSSPQNVGNSPETVDWKTGSKVFSLDLDTLESPSLSRNDRLSLPKLVTFSPMDDLMH